MIAVGPAVPISRRSQMGVPVGVRANLALALAQGSYDVVHGFEPGLPSLSYLALRDTDALTVATFSSPEPALVPARPLAAREAARPARRAARALAEGVRDAAAERFPGDYRVLSPGIEPSLFAPTPKRKLIVVELRPNERAVARSVASRAARAAGLGGGAAAHEAARRPARDPARPGRPRPPAHRARRRLARARC